MAPSWLPAATASGATPVRRRLVKLAATPYINAAAMQASTAQPEPPGLKLALSHASQATPAKPSTRPAMRDALSLSFSHSQATTAPNSGVAALKIDISPAVTDSAA